MRFVSTPTPTCYVRPHLPLDAAHASTLGVHRLVCEPEPGVHVLDVADRVSVFDVRGAHPIHLLPQAKVQLLLQEREQRIMGKHSIEPEQRS